MIRKIIEYVKTQLRVKANKPLTFNVEKHDNGDTSLWIRGEDESYGAYILTPKSTMKYAKFIVNRVLNQL